MQLTTALLSLLLTSSATVTATTFNNFRDLTCQVWNGSYVTVTKTDLEQVVKNGYASASPLIPNASSLFFTDAEKKKCPSNSEDTYKWVNVPQWYAGYPKGPGEGAAVAVVYYKETDTYNLCRNMGNVQPNGYAGLCKEYL
ncbi:hypothetical protein GMOD_00003167 [Pyrenophora seminiperda CCB06]|uniref:Uncharacterized protein n=1 Tax=Pyrenophora seminiperda CCB06 TaxID=1302712 RepID=A0A3M7M427_9PLEO|nr:hypothetical protein GMOD_00003167 [Pyrenophora seminiperda CCB06]